MHFFFSNSFIQTSIQRLNVRTYRVQFPFRYLIYIQRHTHTYVKDLKRDFFRGWGIKCHGHVFLVCLVLNFVCKGFTNILVLFLFLSKRSVSLYFVVWVLSQGRGFNWSPNFENFNPNNRITVTCLVEKVIQIDNLSNHPHYLQLSFPQKE